MHGACMQNDRTSLTIASNNGHHETVEVLLAHKADVNAKDQVSRGEGGEGVPMGARRPWTEYRGLGQGSVINANE